MDEAATEIIEFRLPSLGSDMEEGTVIEWTVAAGDTVAKGDTLLAVETEKGDIDVETWDGGVVTELCAAPGETVPVGTVIARLAVGAASAPRSAEPPAPAPPAPTPPATTPPPPPRDGPAISPRLVYWPSPYETAEEPTSENTIEDPMRRAIARTMERANREIPHYHVLQEVDLHEAELWLRRHNENAPVAERVVMASLLTKATALAAASVPAVNGHWTDQGLRPADAVNVALIVRRRDGGIVAPVISRADERSIVDLMATIKDLVTRAKSGDLSAADLADPTITITNLGDRGVDSVLGVIQPPQVALVGFGRTLERPVVHDGEVVPRSTVTVTLSGDHRASDGQTGARFLHLLDRALQEPTRL